MKDKLWYMSRISIFEALPQEDLLELDHMAPMVHFNAIAKGQVIQTPDMVRDSLFFIKEGKLRLYKLDGEGRQFTAGILGKGNMFGEIASFSFGTNGLYIETMEETVLCSVPKDNFENFLTKRPHLAMKFLTEFSKMLKERDEMLEQMAIGDLRSRVLHLLLKLSERFGSEQKGAFTVIELDLTHQEIANMIGATREGVTVVLQDLKKCGAVETGRRTAAVNQSQARFILGISG
ncbi:Crp/Fnr family transcriptional regulator [Paenibacillus gorillae]|uniref:Crp/Fnr family transcriptional regulator n=1 Tax=Paenibacillus gorillae TaxID=1243662 RepID=UPI0004B9810A|nr:Crp/Fnr family transcriptional regulator [Paenibacillus gorillae]